MGTFFFFKKVRSNYRHEWETTPKIKWDRPLPLIYKSACCIELSVHWPLKAHFDEKNVEIRTCIMGLTWTSFGLAHHCLSSMADPSCPKLSKILKILFPSCLYFSILHVSFTYAFQKSSKLFVRCGSATKCTRRCTQGVFMGWTDPK